MLCLIIVIQKTRPKKSGITINLVTITLQNQKDNNNQEQVQWIPEKEKREMNWNLVKSI